MRLIDADNLLTAFPKSEDEVFHTSAVRGTIAACQTVDAVPVVHGRWIDGHRSRFDGTRYWFRQCDQCLYERDDDDPDKDTNFCPNCGAVMDGKDEA